MWRYLLGKREVWLNFVFKTDFNMAKDKIAYVCSECGYDSAKWLGKCPACGQWDTFKEIRITKENTGRTVLRHDGGLAGGRTQSDAARVVKLRDVETRNEERIDTLDPEFNRVLGGGLVKGSLVLLGGEPGIGKSTLLLQTVLKMNHLRILYVSGEESESQLKMRADRLLPSGDRGIGSECYILCETSLDKIYEQAAALNPDLLIIDSVQAVSTGQGEAFPGSLTQVRDCAVSLLRYVKETGKSVIMVGHITKDGTLAGPKVLEHIVDTVIQFEGDRQYLYRVLRGLKNRFGSTSELGIYEMQSGGLRPVANPSEMLLSQDNEGMSGVAVASAVEGVRPFLIETQALVGTAAYGNPQRSATGFDIRRLNMLLAVLEKRAGFKLAQKDVYLNIAGGLRVSDPAIDLSVAVSILSSAYDQPIKPFTCMAGEIGLSGEIRSVTRLVQRISEAQRLGFRRIIVPRANMKGLDTARIDMELIPAQKLQDALRHLFS